MNLKKLQKDQIPWVDHNFGNRPAWHPLLGCVEEIGELSHSFLKFQQRIRRNENHFENMKDAVGDIVVYLSDFCTAMGFDFQEIVEDTWKIVKSRDWKKFPNNGTTE